VYHVAANHVSRDLQRSFPTIYAKCREIGVDMAGEPIPVVPAAHYFCGGVLTDERGRTTISRLYAAGECACTGIHGANRLASTSLLEALVWGQAVGKDIARHLRGRTALPRAGRGLARLGQPRRWCRTRTPPFAQDWATIRHTMWNYVGIPAPASAWPGLRPTEQPAAPFADFYKSTPISQSLIDLFHGCHAAFLVNVAARSNPETRGCHYRAK
jgi:L-aspartate oxidase